MNSLLAVFKRELKSYFTTPLAYVFLVIFLFFAGYLTFNYRGFYEGRQADMQAFGDDEDPNLAAETALLVLSRR